MPDSDSESHPNFDFNASKGAPLAFAAAFGIALALHSYLGIRHRTFWVWPLIIGLVMEVTGWATRWYSIKELYTAWPDIVSQVSLIVAPAFVAAQNYMLVGRIMSYLGSQYSPISHALITKVFVGADFISILSQAGGGSMLSSDSLSTLKLGFGILMGALAFQVLMFLIFVVITVIFDRRSRQALGAQRDPIQPLFRVFYISAAMIILRSIFRLIEFASVKFTADSASGYFLNHEWGLYVFDAIPMTICVFALGISHAGRFLPSKKGLRIDGSIEPPTPSRFCGCCCIYKRPRSYERAGYAFNGQGPQDLERHELPSRASPYGEGHPMIKPY